jgi:hypothetical protein
MHKLKIGKYIKKRYFFYLPIILILAIFVVSHTNAQIPDGLDLSSISDLTGFNAINVKDVTETAAVEKGNAETAAQTANDKKTWLEQILQWAKDKAWTESGSSLLQNVIRNSIKKLSYDTAKWVASGDWGQGPLYVTEGWGAYLSNIGDEAAGEFIEGLASGIVSDAKLKGMGSICQPDPKLIVKIGLGLREQVRPSKPKCTFSQMKKNWEKEINQKDFLNKFQDMFNPTSNDLGIALTLQTGFIQDIQRAKNIGEKTRQENWGFLDVRNLMSDRYDPSRKAPPGIVQQELGAETYSVRQEVYSYSDDLFVTAANTFLNQLFIELYRKMLRSLGGASYTSPYAGNYNGLSESGGGSGSGSGSENGGGSESGSESGPDLYNQEALTTYTGIAGAKAFLRQLTEPSFASRGDYNIAGELSICPDPSKAGPTNCVITDKFRDAVISKKTVGDAMAEGLLDKSALFGFLANGLEPKYNEGYPYRSMIILRKYRILPVGWELAAEYLKDNVSSAKTKTLGDLVACFDPDDQFQGYYDTWCQGLVDPNWVLKAPQNFCKKQGPGPEITSQDVTGEGAKSKMQISRNEKYCADEQACIKEKNDGSCQLYGYCTEERRKWNFGAESCDPKYNTCQTFRARSGQTVSYLQNSLNYNGCNADNVGCKLYATGGWLSTTTNKFTWSATNTVPMYFDKDIKSCNSSAEGCHEFIRTKPGLGANLLVNSDFENDFNTGDDWLELGGTRLAGGYNSSAYALELAGAGSPHSMGVEVAPSKYDIGGLTYVLSFYAKCTSATAGAAAGTFTLGNAAPATLQPSDNWLRYETGYAYPADYQTSEAFISFDISAGNSCTIDAVKLEAGQSATRYSLYNTVGTIYEKLMPAYLAPYCDGSATQPKDCDRFVTGCTKEEAGCELYTRIKDDMRVPARVLAQDYCPDECVDYDTYIQSATRFDSSRPSYFIPQTARVCSAVDAGCDEFTNLDKISTTTANVAETREYYSYLQQCVKPTAGAVCSEFYTWEGSDETGYQLKVFVLEESSSLPGEPALADSNPAVDNCDADIFKLPSSDPKHNPDCRQLYNRSGGESFHSLRNTIFCTDNCYPYRRTEVNTDPNITQAACVGTDRHWDDIHKECDLCKNGGEWSAGHNACIYMAIPGAGQSCAANMAGCREYRGNTGANKRTVFSSDFENGQLDSWTAIGASPSVLSPSTEALLAGGHSLSVGAGAHHIAKTLGALSVSRGRSYVLSFTARASSTNIKITNIALSSTGTTSVFNIPGGQLALTTDWQMQTVNLLSLDHEPAADEYLEIAATGDLYIDDIKLVEITDQFYLIKDSWLTPETCDQDLEGKAHPGYMLGCAAYYDRDNIGHNLHSFSYLCRQSAVGCEIMIDTRNSTDPASSTVEGYLTPEDRYVYAVYDQKKLCGPTDKGCSRFGQNSYTYGEKLLFKDAYVKNDPDVYSSILCAADEVNCESWTAANGQSYFKDPGDTACEWRQKASSTDKETWGWFQKNVKRCATLVESTNNKEDKRYVFTTQLCQADQDCTKPQICQKEEIDTPCSVSDLLTVGFGGEGSAVKQPYKDGLNVLWAGLCPAAVSGCTEYIDPVSKFNANLIFNADFKDIIANNGSTGHDGWKTSGTGYTQTVNHLSPATLYRLAKNGFAGAVSISCPNASIYELNDRNSLVPIQPGGALTLANNTLDTVSRRIFIASGTPAAKDISCTIGVPGGFANPGPHVEFKEAAIDYQLRNKVDKTTCNGLVDFEKGCVLFNDRYYIGAGYASTTYDADRTIDDKIGVTAESGSSPDENDSNQLLKVEPDRICDQWLSCRSYIKDANGQNVCFDIGLCDSMDENGNCRNLSVSPNANQTLASNWSDFINTTGYAKAGTGGSLESDLLPLSSMPQKGELAVAPNGSFEFYGDNLYPLGWNDGTGEWKTDHFSVINNPITAQSEGVKYPADGRAILRLGAGFYITSGDIDVLPNTEYYLSYSVNTLSLKGAENHAVTANLKTSNSTVPNSVKSGLNWQRQTMLVKTSGSTLTITMENRDDTTGQICKPGNANAKCQGNVYYDDIRLAPVLNKKNDNIMQAQSCRIYPQKDSLSCDYYDETGKRQKGSYGYCLEYDRYPGSTDACLLWWPVDKVKSEGIEEGAGYGDKFPNYYCTEATPYCDTAAGDYGWYCSKLVKTVDDSGQNKYWSGHAKKGTGYEDYVAKSGDGAYIKWGAVDVKPRMESSCEKEEHLNNKPVGCNHNTISMDSCDRVDETDPIIPNGDPMHCGKACYSNSSCTAYGQPCSDALGNGTCECPIDDDKCYCLYYDVPCNDGVKERHYNHDIIDWVDSATTSGQSLNYTRNAQPFGSIRPPYPPTNPYEWDTKANSDKDVTYQPLFVLKPGADKSKANAGTPYYGIDNLNMCRINQNSTTIKGEPPTPPVQGPSGIIQHWKCDCNPSPYDQKCMNEHYGGGNKSYEMVTIAGNWEHCDVSDICVDWTGPSPAKVSAVKQADNTWVITLQDGCGPGGGAGCPGDRISYQCYNSGKDGTPDTTNVSYTDVSLDFNMADTEDQALIGVKRLFAKGYGGWQWKGDEKNGRYIQFNSDAYNWEPPKNFCPGGIRGVVPNDWCGNPPKVEYIKTDANSFANSQFVNLTFNSNLDSEQKPLVMYGVSWGDGSTTTVSGIEMLDRPNPKEPHSLYHLYSYWDMRRNITTNCTIDNTGNCCDPAIGYCCSRPMITIKDNWGWCSIRPDYLSGHPGYINQCNLPENWIQSRSRVCVGENDEVLPIMQSICGIQEVQGADGIKYGTVLANNSKCWLDRNLGATQIAESFNDTYSYGYYYQWGRGNDGHQISTSIVVLNVQSPTDIPPAPNNNKFIAINNVPWPNDDDVDWRTNPVNSLWQALNSATNPCPPGFRIPTISEWSGFVIAEGVNNRTDAINSSLRLPTAGQRHHLDGSIGFLQWGSYWSSTLGVKSTTAKNFFIAQNSITLNNEQGRVHGNSVRCIKD